MSLIYFQIKAPPSNLYPQIYPHYWSAGSPTESAQASRQPNVHPGRLGQRIGRPSPSATICTVSILAANPCLRRQKSTPDLLARSDLKKTFRPTSAIFAFQHFSAGCQVSGLQESPGSNLRFSGVATAPTSSLGCRQIFNLMSCFGILPRSYPHQNPVRGFRFFQVPALPMSTCKQTRSRLQHSSTPPGAKFAAWFAPSTRVMTVRKSSSLLFPTCLTRVLVAKPYKWSYLGGMAIRHTARRETHEKNRAHQDQ